jgi:hypothetical protein
MFKFFKRVLTAAAVVVAASAPSVAYAKFDLELGPSGSTGQAPSPIVSSAPRTAASSGHGFQWDDAAVGAAGVLVLVGVGAGGFVARRRRTHHLLTS